MDGWRCTYVDERGERCPHIDVIGHSLDAHHVPRIAELLAQGLDPFDPRYLRTVCHLCHPKAAAADRAIGAP
jgi:hypothetical protein